MWSILLYGVRLCALASVVALALLQSRAGAAGNIRSGIDLTSLDRTCKPCDDFFQYANGDWIKNNPIPAAYPGWGVGQKLEEDNRAILRAIAEDAAKASAAPGSEEQKVGDFYASCMDTAAINASGIAPIRPLLDLAASAGPSNLGSTLAQLQAARANVFFAFGPTPDAKDSSVNIADVAQGGLGLPDRDYYTRTDEKSKAILLAYRAHVRKMLELLGDAPDAARAEAAGILDLETALAKAQLTIVEQRDPTATYHKMTFASAATLAPAFEFADYVKAAGVDANAPVNVEEPSYLRAASAQIAATPPDALRTYLRWQIVNAYAPALPQPFADEHWSFFEKFLQGSQEQLPRWQRCVTATNRRLGEALGKIYINKTFSSSARATALEMVRSIKAALRDDLATLSWMSPQTRAMAVKKLDAFILKIGYPDKWRDYSKLDINRESYAANEAAARRFQTAYDNAKIGRAVDRTEWEMTPPTVNAYYDPQVNEIVFPAGILQPPFFDSGADMAANYGSIGAVVGHESTHGFDDEGRKFDAEGNLSDWWTPADASRFNVRAKCVVDEWNALEPLPGVHENGPQVEGEEIADLGGLAVAYRAFEKWQLQHPRQTIDGFSPEQRFFLAYAQSWASAYRPEYIKLLAQVDVHGYDKFRANQTLTDMPQFATAFFCKLGDPMVRPKSQQCEIW